jgi:hypothetical protein
MWGGEAGKATNSLERGSPETGFSLPVSKTRKVRLVSWLPLDKMDLGNNSFPPIFILILIENCVCCTISGGNGK